MKSKDICVYCERGFIAENYGTNRSCSQTIDHIIPISKKGVNLMINKVNACGECNTLKSDSTLDEFKESVRLLILTKKDYKTIPTTCFYTMLKNIADLKKYVKEKGDALYKKSKEERIKQHRATGIDRLLPMLPVQQNIRIIKPTKKEKTIVKNLGFYDNPIKLQLAVKEIGNEHQLFLMRQTPKQFRLAQQYGWRIAKMVTDDKCKYYVWEITVYKDNKWITEKRFYQAQKKETDFDLYEIPNKRKDAKFLSIIN